MLTQQENLTKQQGVVIKHKAISKQEQQERLAKDQSSCSAPAPGELGQDVLEGRKQELGFPRKAQQPGGAPLDPQGKCLLWSPPPGSPKGTRHVNFCCVTPILRALGGGGDFTEYLS